MSLITFYNIAFTEKHVKFNLQIQIIVVKYLRLWKREGMERMLWSKEG